MSQWKYNNVKLEIDMEDVEFQERYENAFSYIMMIIYKLDGREED